MPNYFEDYDTTVHFITEEELKANHSGMPHGGVVIRAGKTGEDIIKGWNLVLLWRTIQNLLLVFYWPMLGQFISYQKKDRPEQEHYLIFP